MGLVYFDVGSTGDSVNVSLQMHSGTALKTELDKFKFTFGGDLDFQVTSRGPVIKSLAGAATASLCSMQAPCPLTWPDGRADVRVVSDVARRGRGWPTKWRSSERRCRNRRPTIPQRRGPETCE